MLTECGVEIAGGQSGGVGRGQGEHHLVVAEGAHVLPRNQELGSAAGPYDDPVDEVPTGLLHQVGGQVGESADDAAVAGEDILTGEPAE
ncbi:hypothetical protein MANY_36990 [Mycolicibacterium anyangense]|uniref:Uncharacterized protein n=1 Tax=Mycolicibacterium anyangense TaxID=1431246 RepID=A0A6N4WEJ2_9MYCO|nr:hypothetical protein MANY_36990 [Mycolicibacterium anyangense]